MGLQTFLVFAICCGSGFSRIDFSLKEGAEDSDGGWYTDPLSRIADVGPCNIDVQQASALSQADFLSKYAYSAPVVIKLQPGYNDLFRGLSTKDSLLRDHSNKIIRLSSANTHSYRKVDVSLHVYLDEIMKPQQLDKLGNETFYWFGDNDHEAWSHLFGAYRHPPYRLPDKEPALSFGVAAAGTGVPFHFHGPGFGEIIYGRKRWFLLPPEKVPDFNPNMTTLHWLMYKYEAAASDGQLLECTLGPNEVIFFPDRWWHGTLNIDTSVFMSTFLG